VCLDRGKAVCLSAARRAIRRFGCQRVDYIEFCCRAPSMRRKIAANRLGIRRMSVNTTPPTIKEVLLASLRPQFKSLA
jgi:hypothetical protein